MERLREGSGKSGRLASAGRLISLFRDVRLRTRLLVVNLIALIVPIVGLEFARIYERQLLSALERDMRNQAALVSSVVGHRLSSGATLEEALDRTVLVDAARTTRTRIRLLDRDGIVHVDSHDAGPPEGPEPVAPSVLGVDSDLTVRGTSYGSGSRAEADEGPRWPDVASRPEVLDARRGARATQTRIRGRAPAVLLFLAEPIRSAGRVVGVVYVTRSTQPVLVELYRIRTGLIQVLLVAIVVTALITLVLAWTISRPLSRLSRAAQRIAGGELDVAVPVAGGGEVRELAESFSAMKVRLDERDAYIRQFAADVAHEFKSPLTSIGGAAELLREGAADDVEARDRFLKNIELDVQRLDRLVTRLLQLSRIEASAEAMTVVDLRCLVEQVASSYSDAAPSVEVAYDAPTTFAWARRADLETAVINLVENARRASPPGAPVVIRISEETFPAGFERSRERRRPQGEGSSGRGLRVEVCDEGPGIPEAIRDRVFERFFTTDGERRGTGLGLAIVAVVAKAHGSDVQVACPDKGGTRVSFVVPSAGQGLDQQASKQKR